MIGKYELRGYLDSKIELDQLERRIEQIRTQLYALRSPSLTGMPHAQNVDPGSSQERSADRLSESLNALNEQYANDAAELACRCAEIETALRLLPARYRSILRAHYVEGMKWPDVAEIYPYSYERIMQLHRRALILLRERQTLQ